MTSNFDHDIRAIASSDYSFDFQPTRSMLTPSSIPDLRDMERFSSSYSEPGTFEFTSGPRSQYDMLLSNNHTNGHHHHHHHHRYQPDQYVAKPLPNQPGVVKIATGETPPFHETEQELNLFTDAGQPVIPNIAAQMPKNFFYISSESAWGCYRRNYINLSASFALQGWTPDVPLYVKLRDGEAARVRAFSITLSAEVEKGHESRGLVQHTPKRDRRCEKPPPRVVLMPMPMSGLGGLEHEAEGLHNVADYKGQKGVEECPLSLTSHTFERIQFAKATANNGRRPSAQQFYTMIVELSVDVGNPNTESRWEKVAVKKSKGLVVRGRSPNHYRNDGNNVGVNTEASSQRPHFVEGGNAPVAGFDSTMSASASASASATDIDCISHLAILPPMQHPGTKRSCSWELDSGVNVDVDGMRDFASYHTPPPFKRRHLAGGGGGSETDTDDYCDGVATYPDLDFAR